MREFEEATRRALEELARRDPALMASSAAAVYSYPDRSLTLTCLDGEARVAFPGGGVTVGGEPVEGALPLIILHYLLGAQRLEPAREWIAYRDLPGARYHDSAFRAEVELPLAEALQESPEADQRLGRGEGPGAERARRDLLRLARPPAGPPALRPQPGGRGIPGRGARLLRRHRPLPPAHRGPRDVGGTGRPTPHRDPLTGLPGIYGSW